MTPVSVSPFRIAQATGEAPRYLGRREKWTLTVRSGGKIDDRDRENLAVGDHDLDVRGGGLQTLQRRFVLPDAHGLEDGEAAVEGQPLDGQGVSFRPRPAGLSGWVTTSGISWPAPSRRSSEGRAAAGLP